MLVEGSLHPVVADVKRVQLLSLFPQEFGWIDG
jgi:hypothetical protein